MCLQVESEFILESERESFIEQVREVIENADEKGLERDSNSQVNTTMTLYSLFLALFPLWLGEVLLLLNRSFTAHR